MAETVTSVFGGHMTETVERRRDTQDTVQAWSLTSLHEKLINMKRIATEPQQADHGPSGTQESKECRIGRLEVAHRLIVTIAILAFAVGAFFGAGPTEAGLLNSFGICFLGLAVLVWFAWKPMMGGLREAVPTPTGWGLGAPAPLPPSSKLKPK
jgi:hypothetical protein